MISSRTLLLSLIALNLLALAWWSGAMSPLSDSVREPHRLEGQIEPDRLKLVGTLASKSAGGDAVAKVTQPANAPTQTAQGPDSQASVGVLALPFSSKEAGPPKLIALPAASGYPGLIKLPASLKVPGYVQDDQWMEKPDQIDSTVLPMVAAAISGTSSIQAPGIESTICARYSGMSYIEARELEDDLLEFGATVSLKRADTGSYLVYIDPLATEQLASRKRAQLRDLGLTDLQVIRSGYYRNGISLGLLRSFSLAKKHQAELASLGVSAMRIGPVNVASARYDMVVEAESRPIAQKIKSHEVLSLMAAGDCDR